MLAPWKKIMTNLDSILKTETLLCQKNVHLVKSVLFPIVMYWCDSWSIKKAQCQRNDTFELWCWRRLLRVPWTARRSNQSILKEISPEYSLEGLMLKLKLQYFGHMHCRQILYHLSYQGNPSIQNQYTNVSCILYPNSNLSEREI